MIYCSVKYCCSISSIPGVILMDYEIHQNTKSPRLSLKYTLTPRSMSSRTVQFLVILRTQAIYVYLFIYGSKHLLHKNIGIHPVTTLEYIFSSFESNPYNVYPSLTSNRYQNSYPSVNICIHPISN